MPISQAYTGNYPMWHHRFVDARNHLAEAVNLMEQAYFEDRNNITFFKLFNRMRAVMKSVDSQSMKNYKRVKKEGYGKS